MPDQQTPDTPTAAQRQSPRHIFRALKHRNYRLFFIGQGISLMGTWTQRVAMGWLVYRLTNSEMLLGIVGFSSMILSFFFSPVAGVLADRTDKKRLLIITQCVSMIQAFVLAGLTLSGLITVPWIIALSAILGFVNSFDVPIRQSFQVEMVGTREDLPNAIALNSFIFHGSKLIGPAVAGVLISLVGEGICFLINAISFVTVLFALMAIRTTPRPSVSKGVHPLQTLKEGFQYAYGFLPIRAILAQLALSSLLGMGLGVLMPVFARDILHGDSRTMGFLMSASGMGAVIGTIYLASRRSPQGLGTIIASGGLIYGIVTIAFALSRNLYLSLGLIAISGFGSMIQMVSTNTLLQTLVEDDKRGRVMSLYAMALMGMAPIGSLMSGWIADLSSSQTALLLLGMGCIATSAVFATWLPRLAPMVHPIYVERGIIIQAPPAATTTPSLASGQRFRM